MLFRYTPYTSLTEVSLTLTFAISPSITAFSWAILLLSMRAFSTRGLISSNSGNDSSRSTWIILYTSYKPSGSSTSNTSPSFRDKRVPLDATGISFSFWRRTRSYSRPSLSAVSERSLFPCMFFALAITVPRRSFSTPFITR